MIETYRENKFNTKLGEFILKPVKQGSVELLRNGVAYVAGCSLENKELYIREDIYGLDKGSMVDWFIKSVNEETITESTYRP